MCLSMSNVVVCARVRPGSDLSDESSQCITCGADNDLDLTFDSLNGSKNVLNFQLDHVFGPTATQEIIFNNLVKPMINEALQGYNMTLFTFGQTGSGKTFTMQGTGKDDQRGITYRTAEELFIKIDEINAKAASSSSSSGDPPTTTATASVAAAAVVKVSWAKPSIIVTFII